MAYYLPQIHFGSGKYEGRVLTQVENQGQKRKFVLVKFSKLNHLQKFILTKF